MKIRAITCFVNPAKSNYRSVLVSLGAFIEQAAEGLNSSGYQVQSKRLATVPFPKYIKANKLLKPIFCCKNCLPWWNKPVFNTYPWVNAIRIISNTTPSFLIS